MAEDNAAPADDAAPVVDDAIDDKPIVDDAIDDTPVEETKFNKTQLQQISSIMGNMIKKTVEEQILPAVSQPQPMDDPTSPAFEKFNSELQDMILQGNVMGAFDKYTQVKDQARKNLTQKQELTLNKEISGYENEPHYKDVFPDMKSLASDFVKQGYPPKPAAELAYHKTLTRHLTKQSPDPVKLGMAGGGRRPEPAKKTTLPPNFKAAFERDKAKGLFKTEEDFISSLSPQVRSQYGI